MIIIWGNALSVKMGRSFYSFNKKNIESRDFQRKMIWRNLVKN